MSIDQFHQFPDREDLARLAVVKKAGMLLANHFLLQKHPQLLLDMDGVVFQSDSLDIPRLTTPDIIPTLKLLEDQGVSIGPATRRGMQVIDFLRNQGLEISGPAILEEGHMIVQNGIVEYLSHPNQEKFMNTVKAAMEQDEEYLPTWSDTLAEIQSGKFAFCPGNFRW